MVTFAQVIQAAHAFPGTRGEDSFVLRTEFLDREILMQSDPTVFYITEHYRDHPWKERRTASEAEREGLAHCRSPRYMVKDSYG
jgi:hypothetical protein